MLALPSLRAALEAYRPLGGAEAEHHARCLALLDHPGDPCSRLNFVPGHFTASAFVLAPDQPQVLLIHHRKLGRWLQPGGHFEADDRTLLDAAGREVEEETGLRGLEPMVEGIFDIDIHGIPAHGKEPPHEHFDVRVLLRAVEHEVVAGVGVRAARWCGWGEVELETSDASVLRALDKLRQV